MSFLPHSLLQFPHVQKEGWASRHVSCSAARVGVVAWPELPWAGCRDSKAQQGSAWQAASMSLPVAAATPSAQNCILTPSTELRVAPGKEGIFHGPCEIWPLPKAEHPHMAGTIQHSGRDSRAHWSHPSPALPAQLPAPGSPCSPAQPRAPLPRLQHREVPMATSTAPPGTSYSHSGERAAPARA